MVEARGEIDQRRVAPRAHIGDDRAHGIGDIRGVFAGSDEGGERGFKPGVARVEPARHLSRSNRARGGRARPRGR